MGLEALGEEDDEEIEKKVKGEESMMDETGKRSSTNGCKNKVRICTEV